MGSRRTNVFVATALAAILLGVWTASPAAAQIRCGSGPLGTDGFTVMTLPDTQYHTETEFSIQTSWIVSKQPNLNTVFVSHLGDIVNNGDEAEGQYEGALSAMSMLDGVIEYGFAPGNHDNNAAKTGLARLYDEYFPTSKFVGRPGFAGSYNSNRSNFQLFSASGLDFMILHLEYDPLDHVLDWANAVLAAYPNRRVIVSTHVFLHPNASVVNDLSNSPWDVADGNSPQEVWDELIFPNCNVFMVINGHYVNDGENNITATNTCGDTVHLALSNYQERQADLWLRYYIFKPTENEIRAVTYSPFLLQCENDADSRFDMTYDMGGTP